MNKIFIVIPVHNRKGLTKNCLLSLYRQTYKDFKITIFDDGSTDGTKEMIEKEFPEVILLKGSGNFWWSKSVNNTVKYALDRDAEYILTLNDDLEVEKNYIENMVKYAKNNPDILMGSACHDIKTKELVFAGSRINWLRAKEEMIADILSGDELKNSLVSVSHFGCRGLWIPSKVFNKIGLFDEENFPQSIADYDFTLRAGRAGFKIYCNFDAKVYSYIEEKGTVKFKKDKSLRNFINYLTHIKSDCRLITRWKFGLKNCPFKYLFQYLILDTGRVIGGYFER